MTHHWITSGPVSAPRQIAVEETKGAGPTIHWLNGFRSNMASSKATAVAEWGASHGRRVVRCDYSGHGMSSGRFEDGTISQWFGDAIAVLDQLCPGPVQLCGSSMGGWISLLIARELLARGEINRITSLLLIAPAPDFTKDLLEPMVTRAQRDELATTGRIVQLSPYDPEPLIITQALLDDGRSNLIFPAPLPLSAPVTILQGRQDTSVPPSHTEKLIAKFQAEGVSVHTKWIDDGDHRLSRPQDLAFLYQALEGSLF